MIRMVTREETADGGFTTVEDFAEVVLPCAAAAGPGVLVDQVLLTRASQGSTRVHHNRWLTGVMVMLCDGVHGVSCRSALLMNTLHGAVTNGTTIVP